MKRITTLLILASLLGCSKENPGPPPSALEQKRMDQGLPRNIDLFSGGILKPDLMPGKSQKLSVRDCDFLRPVGSNKVEIGCTVEGSPEAYGPLFFQAHDMGAVMIAEGPVLGPDVPIIGAAKFSMVIPNEAKVVTLYLR